MPVMIDTYVEEITVWEFLEKCVSYVDYTKA